MITDVHFDMDVAADKKRGGDEGMMEKYLNYGLPCDLAGLIKQHRLAKKRFNLSIKNLTDELVKRSIIWYGRPPDFHIQWLSLYQ